MPSSKRKFPFVLLSGILGLAALAVAYDWYRDRYQRTLLFDAGGLALPAELAGPGAIRLVHFHDPACPCNVGNQGHLAELVERYGAQGVTFHAVQRPGSRGGLPPTLAAVQPLAALPGGERLPGSPALAIWDRQGRLAYVGPYSEGAACTSANSFVEPVLDALLEDQPVQAGGTLATGCFCDWQTP